MLIPSERIQALTNFADPTIELNDSVSKTTKVESRNILPYIQPDLDYLVRLNLEAICRYEKQFHVLKYNFQIGSKKIVDEMIINCDLRYIYVEKNSWVPYNLRYWVPPILVDIFKTVEVDWPLVYMSGSEIIDLMQKLTPVFEFIESIPIIIDSRHTTIDFVVEWDGIRFYMTNYYLTSLFVGAGGFWLLTSWVCLLTSLVFLSYILRDTEEKTSVKTIDRKVDREVNTK